MGGGDTSIIASLGFQKLECSAAFDCNLDFDNYGGIVLWILLMLYMFKALGVICDEYFVPALEVIVEKLGLSNDVAGATFMAAGSSAPELFTSLVATFLIVSEGGVGTIIGSAIFNVLVIVGATGYVACTEGKALDIFWYPLLRDCLWYSLSIVELMIVLNDEVVEWYEGVIMVVSYIGYCLYMKVNPMLVDRFGLVKHDRMEEAEVEDKDGNEATVVEVQETKGNGDLRKEAAASEEVPGPPEHHLGSTDQCGTLRPPGLPPGELEGEEEDKGKVEWSLHDYKKSVHSPRSPCPSEPEKPEAQTTEAVKPPLEEPPKLQKEDSAPSAAEPEPEPERCRWCRDPLTLLWEYTMPSPDNHYWILFSLSILWIGVCTFLMVDATDRTGKILHIPPLAMALVFLAAGTSIPDALGSIAVAKQGEGDMAVCNALGSNVFDILVGLGVPWTIKRAIGHEIKFEGKWKELIWDIVILCGVLVLFIGSLVLNRWRLTRTIGLVLLFFYALFLVYNILAVWVFELKSAADT